MFILGRLTNTLGWLHQELGDFQRAVAYDRDSADLGQRIGNSNVEISALINLGFDYLHLGEPEKASPCWKTRSAAPSRVLGAPVALDHAPVRCIADTLLVLEPPTGR